MTDRYSPHDRLRPENAESIIELTDVVASPGATKEEIIELTEVVENQAGGEDAVIELTEVVESPRAEEYIIELTEVVSAAGNDREAAMAEAAPLDNVEDSTSSDLAFAEMDLHIENSTDDDLFDSLNMSLEADLLPSSEDSDELDFNLSTQELSDAIDLLDAKLAEDPLKPPAIGKVHIEPSSPLGSEQLETALENVIKKMMGEKIDHLLNDAIERTVSAEIARLKEQLLGDNSEKS